MSLVFPLPLLVILTVIVRDILAWDPRRDHRVACERWPRRIKCHIIFRHPFHTPSRIVCPPTPPVDDTRSFYCVVIIVVPNGLVDFVPSSVWHGRHKRPSTEDVVLTHRSLSTSPRPFSRQQIALVIETKGVRHHFMT